MSSAFRETNVSFKTRDGKTLYAGFIQSQPRLSDKLIIYAHGLPSCRDDYTYLNSARLFARKGFDTLRPSFYDWRINARCFTECDIGIHVADLEQTIKKFSRQYKNIYLIGHSWGGLVIMHSACKYVAAVSLWDPSYQPALWWRDFCRNHKGLTICKTATEFLISPVMQKQAMSLDKKACQQLSANFTKPVQVLQAEVDGFLYKIGQSFHSQTNQPADYHLLAEADHSFLAEAAQKKAVNLTARWFNRF